MKNIKIKIKEVYLPFLLVSIGTFVFYNLVRWTFDVHLGILPLKEDLLNFWIPLAFPWLPLLIWLRRRIRILDVNGQSDNGYFAYQFAMVLAIAFPIIVSQNYVEKAPYNLIKINNVEEVNQYENEKFFKFSAFNLKKIYSTFSVTARTSGRYKDKLHFHLFISTPFENSNNIWYGVKYSKTISNQYSDASKNYDYKSFIEKSKKEFETYDFQNVNYFEKLGYSDDRDGFLAAIKAATPQVNINEQIILTPKLDEFKQRLGTTLPWIFGSFGIGALVILIMVIIPKINRNELNDFKKDKPLKEDNLKDIINFLDLRGANKGTALLLLTNFAFFLVMIFIGLNIISPTTKELLDVGGNRRYEVMEGEYWRLLMSLFIHSGLMHLLMNLFGLGISANLLEKILGSTILVISFLVSGILASLASIYWHEDTVSVGASGAIFGLYGIILAFTIFKIYPNHMRRLTWALLGLYAGISLLFGLFGGIDNAAHIGGLISGFIIGVIFILYEKENLIKNAS